MGTWRLVLAWLVIANHTAGLQDISTGLALGKVAVAAFFFISGFLMPLTFDTHYSRYGTIAGSRKFYVNRFLRIFPIYWASLLLTLLAVLAYGPTLMEHANTLEDLRHTRTYLSNLLLLGLNQTRAWGGDFRFNPPAWTLDVELQYYLLVPFILWMTVRRRAGVAAVLVAFAVASTYLFFRPVGFSDVDRSLLAWALFFFMGYVFYLSPRLQEMAIRRSVVIIAIVAMLLVAWLSRHQNVAILSATFACVAGSAYLLVIQQDRAFGPLDRLLGDLSYPTYILHWVCVQLIWRWFGEDLIRMAAAARFSLLLLMNILLSTLVAYASLRLIGDPIETLRRRIRDGKSTREARQ
jgi:peptidoglycan/LPS O-acetylase OafA/YrhL